MFGFRFMALIAPTYPPSHAAHTLLRTVLFACPHQRTPAFRRAGGQMESDRTPRALRETLRVFLLPCLCPVFPLVSTQRCPGTHTPRAASRDNHFCSPLPRAICRLPACNSLHFALKQYFIP